MATPKYALRIARLPQVFALLTARPDGIPLAELAGQIGVPADELREDLLAFYTADLNPMLFGLSRPSVLEFLGPDGDEIDPNEAEIVRGLWARVEDAVWFKSGAGTKGGVGVADDRPLIRYLKRGAGGRRVVELGFEADVADAAALNRAGYQLAVELRRDPLRLVAAGENRPSQATSRAV